MKKLLTTLALFTALALTSCGAKPATSGEESKPAGESQASSAQTTSSKHSHTYDETKWEHNDNQHWHPATCEHTDSKGSAAAHTWVDDTTKTGKAATCSEEGIAYKVCSVCGATKEEKLPKTDHNWELISIHTAPEAGYVASSFYTCMGSNPTHLALRFKANEFNTELSTTDIEKNGASSSNPNSIRLVTAQTQTKTGSKIVYKFRINDDAQKATLSMNAVLKYGSGAPAPVFDYVSGDEQQGYVQNETGEWTLTTKRYQLKVNDVIIPLGQDNYGGDITGEAGDPHWYDWPVEFNLTKGDNTLEILCLGGYRAYLYDFQINNLPASAQPR